VELQKLKSREVTIDRSLQSTFGTLARIEAKVNKYQEQQDSLENKATLLVSEYISSQDPASLLKAKGIHTVLSLLENKLFQYDQDLSALKNANESEATSLRKEQSECLQRETELSTKIKHYQKDLASKQISVQSLKKGVSSEASIEETIQNLTGQLSAQNERFENLKDAMDLIEIEEKRVSLAKQVDKLNEQRRILDADFVKISSQSQKRASLEHSHKRFKEKSDELEKLRNENRELFQTTLQIDLEASSNILDGIGSRIKDLESQENEFRKKQTQIKQKVSEYQGQLKSCKQLFDSCQSNLESSVRQLQAVCADYHDFPSSLENAKRDLEDARNEIGIKQSAEFMYSQFLDCAKRRSKCMVCDRGFPSSEEARRFEAKLKAFIEALPEDASSAKKKFEETEALYKSFQKLSGTWEKAQELENITIPEHTAKFTALKERLKVVREKEEKVSVRLADLKGQLETIRPLHEIAVTMARLTSELEKLSSNVKFEEEQLRSFDSDTRTSEEVLTLKGQTEKEIDSLIAAQMEFQNKCIEQERAIAELTTAISANENKLRVAKEELKRVKAQRLQYDEGVKEVTQLEKTIEALKEQLLTEQAQLGALKSKIMSHASKCRETEAESMKKKYDLEKKLGPLKALYSELKSFNLIDESREMEKLRSDQTSYRNDLDSIRKQIEEIQNIVFLGDQEALNSGSMMRNIENNIKYRELLEQTEKEKKHLEDFLKNNRDITEEVEQISSKKKTIEEKRDGIKAKWDKCKGVRIQLREDIVSLQQERGQSKFADVEKNHRKKVIEVQVTELSVKDLEVYYKALDRALVKYHSAKMAEINTTIKELWQSTYKGEDIDCIEIRSELPPNSSHTKRAYDYRVVMIKGDVDIDMRGRCSAGQKVLASLVIRLALAETFCVNCGILALDEPTTNLDRRNVESFANALVEIVENRRRQKHFQLIVITHDEEFVQLLGKSNNADFYWRVSKVSGGSSILKRHEISDLS
jgi:DNA repair protein RAD50